MPGKWLLIILIPLLAFSSWLFGSMYFVDENQNLAQNNILSRGYKYERINPVKWCITDSLKNNVGYAYIGTGEGYGGPMAVMTFTDTNNAITDVEVVMHSETHSYYQKLDEESFFQGLLNSHPLELKSEDEIDVISGATLSCNGVVEGIKSGYSKGESNDYQNRLFLLFNDKGIVVILLLFMGFMIIGVRRMLRA